VRSLTSARGRGASSGSRRRPTFLAGAGRVGRGAHDILPYRCRLRQRWHPIIELIDLVTSDPHDRRVDATAADLFVHPNTVRHRLRRFTELTDLELDTTFEAVAAWWAARSRAGRR
jgi:hypothetical protein